MSTHTHCRESLAQAGAAARPSRIARSLRWLANRVETRHLQRQRARMARDTARQLRRMDERELQDLGVERAQVDLLAAGLLGPESYWRGFGGRR